MTTEAQHLSTTMANGVLTVTFDRPAAYNAMTFAMYEALYDACERADADEDVRVMVLRGAGGKAFVAGTDIPELEAFVREHGGVDYEARLERVVDRLERVRVPVLAAVDGVAAGGGLVLVAASDLCVCTTRSRFGAPMARTLGNCLSVRNLRRMERAIGARRAKALLLTADLVDADEAQRAGLVHDVTTPEAFEPAVARLADKLRSRAPLTLEVSKAASRALAERTPAALAEQDRAWLRRCYGSDDFLEGVRSFQEKRDPAWRGE